MLSGVLLLNPLQRRFLLLEQSDLGRIETLCSVYSGSYGIGYFTSAKVMKAGWGTWRFLVIILFHSESLSNLDGLLVRNMTNGYLFENGYHLKKSGECKGNEVKMTIVHFSCPITTHTDTSM